MRNCAVHTRRVRRLASVGLLVAATTYAALGAEPAARTFNLYAKPKPVPAFEVEDAQGKIRGLADLKGRTVLLNIWATWCVPCRKEMPSLDRLQAMMEPDELTVLPLSIDRGGMDVVRSFYAEVGIKKLGLYRDVSGNVTRQLGAVGIPTTLLIDREGFEIGRLIGPAEWDSPEMVRFIKCAIGNDGAGGSAKDAESATAECPK